MEGGPIVVVGSLNFDLITQVESFPAPGETIQGLEFRSYPGGKGANQAVAVARLGYPVYMIGRVGRDAFAEELRERLEGAGVDVTFVARSERPSGIALIVVAKSGENTIVVTPGANALLLPEELQPNLELIRSASLVLTQLEIPMVTVRYLAKLCAESEAPLILDPAPAQRLPQELLRFISWITPNEVEARQLSGMGGGAAEKASIGDLSNRLRSLGSKNVLLKLGERGAYLATNDGIGVSIPAHAVRAVDATGAGDAFNGAFAVALARGAAPLEAAKFASAAAAISVTRAGALPSMPVKEEVDAFLRENPLPEAQHGSDTQKCR